MASLLPARSTAKRLSPLMTTPKYRAVTGNQKTKARVHTNKTGKNVKWTPEDDEALRRAVKKHDEKNWKAIALEGFGGAKSDVQCLHRWRKVLDPSIKKGPWTPDEDRLILIGIEAHGEGKWSDIAKSIPGRLGKQCRERWMNHLDPKIRKDPFTEEEDAKIIELHAKYGTQWTKIRKDLPGRTDNAIKNRFYSHLRRRVGAIAQKRAPIKPHKPKKTKPPARKRKITSNLVDKMTANGVIVIPTIPNVNTRIPVQPRNRNEKKFKSPKEPKDRSLASTRIPNLKLNSSVTPDALVLSPPQPSTPPPADAPQARRQSFSPALKNKKTSSDLYFNAYPNVKKESPVPSQPKKMTFETPRYADSPNIPRHIPRWPQGLSAHSPSPRTPHIGSGLGFTSPPPRTPLEMPMFTSPGPRTPDCRRMLPSDLSSPCPPMTPLSVHEGKNLMEMMDEAESDSKQDLTHEFSDAR